MGKRRNRTDFEERVHAALVRFVAAQPLMPIRRDGRAFYCVENIEADSALVRLLDELGGPRLKHAPQCAAYTKVRPCDCLVSAAIAGLTSEKQR